MPSRGRVGGRETVPEIEIGLLPKSGDGSRVPVLVVLNGPQVGERKSLGNAAIEVGRDPSADFVLRDPLVAWRHARIAPSRDGWEVQDLGQAEHGVELNGIRVSCAPLAHDDCLQLGATVLRFELHDPVEQAFDRAVEERLMRDDLTGLLSRRHWEMRLAAHLEAVREGGGTVGLAVLDLDRLKEINDRHGHLVGARVIADVGRAIGAALPAQALACRLGGDEFAIALPGADGDAIEALARAVRDRVVALDLQHDGEDISVGISAGIAVGPAQGAHATALLRAADEALMRAKRRGRAQIAR